MGRHESPRGVDGTLANDYYQSSRGVERRREAIEPGGRSGEASRRRKKKRRRNRSGSTGAVGEDSGGNDSRGSDESVAVDEQIDTNHGGGVDPSRSLGHMGDGSALPERYGVFVAGQPQDEGRTATRQPGCSVPVHQSAGESIVGGGRPGDFGRCQEEGI